MVCICGAAGFVVVVVNVVVLDHPRPSLQTPIKFVGTVVLWKFVDDLDVCRSPARMVPKVVPSPIT